MCTPMNSTLYYVKRGFNMKRNTKLLYVLLSVLFLTIPMGIATSAPSGSTTTKANSAIPSADYDFGNRRSPINILIYTEYSDTTSGGEWENTISAILEVYGPAFEYENLTDYTQLGSMIDDFDVVLIAEQETATPAESVTIGTAWQGVLTDFVLTGGILISLDGGTTAPQGGGKILNATNLLKTYNEVLINGLGVGKINDTNALAFDVGSSFPGPNAAWAVDVTDATIVFEHSTSHKAYVAYKTMGEGHIVYIGADFNTPDSNTKLILANAIRLTNHVVFDNTHGSYDPLSGFNNFAVKLADAGFAITTMNNFNEELISMCDVLVVGSYSGLQYSSAEASFIRDMVAGGIGLLVFSDYGGFGNTTEPILAEFDIAYDDRSDSLGDSDENGGSNYHPIYGSGNILNHSTTIGVNTIQCYGGTAFTSVPAGATVIVTSDTDGTAEWSISHDPAPGLAVAVALHYGAGRVFALSDIDILGDNNWDGDGSLDFLDEDNEEFGLSITCWLSAAGIQEKTILFDESRIPTYSVKGAYIEFARLLSFNGFNIRWMTEFSDVMVDEADVMIVVDGSENHTVSEISSIVGFVNRGGGLFLISDQLTFSTEIYDIGIEFGLQLNTTGGAISDSDDYQIDPRYTIWEGDKIATHPIMTGVERMELDLSGGFASIGSGVSLLTTDTDGTATWTLGGLAHGVSTIAATTHNLGRVIGITDINLPDTGGSDGDGYGYLYDSDNDVFFCNAFYWLIENRAPIVEVTFPNGGEILNATQIVEWTAVDPNRDELTFDLFISDNNGSDWSGLASGISGLAFEWNTTLHDDGDSYMIRVVASDGILTDQDDSDGPFELDNFQGVPGLPLDPLILILIGAGVVIVIVILVILSKKKGGGKKK